MKIEKPMIVKFKKDFYNKAEFNPETGKHEINTDKMYTMYHFSINKDYFIEDKQEALKAAIKDLKDKVKELEEIYNQNDKTLESWDSISK